MQDWTPRSPWPRPVNDRAFWYLPTMSNDQELNQAAVAHVAKLARLDLASDQLESYQQQLARVLEHVAKLSELDVAGVDPMNHPPPPPGAEASSINRLDEDCIQPSLKTEQFLENAPEKQGSLLAVPKVLGDGGGA